MGKYSLVVINCNDVKRRVREIKIDGVDLTNLFTIDNFTSGMNLQQLWRIIWAKYDLHGFNKLAIKYDVKKGEKTIYYDVIVDNKIINICSEDVELKYFADGKYRYSYAIRRDNVIFRRVFDDLMNFIDICDVDKYREMYFRNNKELFRLIKIYNSTFNSMIQGKDCEKFESMIEDELSRYVTFRKYIISLDRASNMNRHDKSNFSYTDEETASMYNRENDEFIEPSEVRQMGLVDDFDYKRKLVRSK